MAFIGSFTRGELGKRLEKSSIHENHKSWVENCRATKMEHIVTLDLVRFAKDWTMQLYDFSLGNPASILALDNISEEVSVREFQG